MAGERPQPLIVYHNRARGARDLAEALGTRLGVTHPIWPVDDVARLDVEGAVSVVVTIGGDGTILRAVQLAAPMGVPLLGVNMGRLGFLTEVEAHDALELVPRYLEPDYAWVEERCMVQARVEPSAAVPAPAPLHALNEMVVGRGSAARLVTMAVSIDGVELATFKADAVIVATATGSTGYVLSAGGPILYPTSSDLVLKAVAPQAGPTAAIVVPGGPVVGLTALTDLPISLSADGFQEVPMAEGDTVFVSPSPHVARFLRVGPVSKFYERLVGRLLRWVEREMGQPSSPQPAEAERRA